MSRPSSSTLLAAVLAGVLLCACAKHDAGHNEATQRHVWALKNPSSFPLYPNSTVVTVVPVDSAQIFAAIRATDPHADLPPNYRGHEIIAETNASMAQLAAWVRTLKASPPQGLRDTSQTASTRSSGDDGMNVNTEVGAKFDSRSGDRTVFVFTADPRKIRQQLGPAFTLFDSYSAVPGVLRAPIDEEAKKQFGYSVTEMLDAKSPVGAAIAELKRLQDTDRRAILIIDESKS
ncbi:MAG: hypothetical protein JWM87_3920 [Candidatus Eremiobacteraeota bacterium]|nr:hypothetical protein [Candidatus Eremiobacteraeota bacterium]